MIRRTALALAAVMAMALPASGPASAKVNIDIDIGLGVIGYGGYYGKNISCERGRRIVEHHFNKVKPRDCGGKVYGYVGWKKGKRYFIRVSAYSGRIVDVDRW